MIIVNQNKKILKISQIHFLNFLTILITQNGGGKNFGDGYNINQRWYIEQATPNQGFLEVKIWTKVSCVFISSLHMYINCPFYFYQTYIFFPKEFKL